MINENYFFLFKFIVVLIFTKYLKMAKQNGNFSFGNIELDFQYMNDKVHITFAAVCLWDMSETHILSEKHPFLDKQRLYTI